MDWKKLCAPLVLFVAVAVAGCGGGGDEGRQPTYEVSGKVTLAGSPVVGATVTFYPNEDQRSPVGMTDDNGEYVLTTYEYGDGAMLGQYSVGLSKAMPKKSANISEDEAHAAIERGEDPTGHDAGSDDPEAGSALPIRYSSPDESGFSATVTADGENRFDFAMDP